MYAETAQSLELAGGIKEIKSLQKHSVSIFYLTYKQWRIQDFPEWRQPQGGDANLLFGQISLKTE